VTESTLTDCETGTEAQLREVDYWIAMSEKVGVERLLHEGMPDGQKTFSFV